jgi:hypothetical protein
MGYISTMIALNRACDRLREELDKTREKLVVINSNDKIEVHGPVSIKAHIPKTWDGWIVKFVVWDGKERRMHIDTDIV